MSYTNFYNKLMFLIVIDLFKAVPRDNISAYWDELLLNVSI